MLYLGFLVIKLRGLPWSVTKEQIVNFLQGVAIDGGENGIHFINNGKKKNFSGNAFVVCATENDYVKSFSKDKNTIGTRYIEGKLNVMKDVLIL